MAAIKIIVVSRLPVMVLFMYLCVLEAKTTDNKTNINNSAEVKPPKKISDSGALMFADELKQTLEKYLFGICPQSYKSRWFQMPLASKGKNITTLTCDLDEEQQDLAGKLATLALRAHTASRSDCTRFGVALANTLGELARTAASRQTISSAAANEANKKQRKLSKSQKLKIQAKQKTALAVKKKAAAVAAAAAAKMTS